MTTPRKGAARKRARKRAAPKPATKPQAKTAAELSTAELESMLPDPTVTQSLADAGDVPDPGAPLPAPEGEPDSAELESVPPPLSDPKHWSDARCEFYLRTIVNPMFRQLGKPELTSDEMAEGGEVLGECIRRVLGPVDNPWIALLLWTGVVVGSRYSFELLGLLAQSRAGRQLAGWIAARFRARSLVIVQEGDAGAAVS